MYATKAKYKSKAVNGSGKVIEHSLGFRDHLPPEPAQHPVELGLLKRDPGQDGVLERDARAPGLPGGAPLAAVVVASDAGLLELHDEIILTDLRVVVVDEVAAVLVRKLLAELEHTEGVLVKRLGLRHIVRVVPLEHRHLGLRQRGAHRERQVFNVVATHVELQYLQTGGPGLVVKVMNLEQVDLRHEAVRRVDLVRPLAITLVLRVDDRHRLLVQRGRV